MSHYVIIALGSNSEPRANIAHAIGQLRLLLADMHCSEAIWTEPIGMAGNLFLNQLVSGRTDIDADALISTLKQMEHDSGRRKGHVTLDADLLLFEQQRYHAADWQRPYIQQLMKQL